MYNKQPNNKQPGLSPNKQPNNHIETEIEPGLPVKASWAPPDIEFKPLKHQYLRQRKPNVKCIFCGAEYYKKCSKIKLNICDACNKENEHPKQYLSPLTTSQLLGISAKESCTIPETLPEPEAVAAKVSCKCGSTSYIKHGKRIKKGKDGGVVAIQKYQCLKCASFFSSKLSNYG